MSTDRNARPRRPTDLWALVITGSTPEDIVGVWPTRAEAQAFARQFPDYDLRIDRVSLSPPAIGWWTCAIPERGEEPTFGFREIDEEERTAPPRGDGEYVYGRTQEEAWARARRASRRTTKSARTSSSLVVRPGDMS